MARAVMKRGLSYDIFEQATRAAFVEIASNDFGVSGKKQTTSRISMITGLSRKEVSRLQNIDTSKPLSTPVSLNRAAKVVNGWLTDSDYTDHNNQPRTLDIGVGDDCAGAGFNSLVKKYSGDITAVTILEELKQIDAIRLEPSGKIKLQKAAYIPAQDSLEQLQLLAEDISELIDTIEFNTAQDNPHSKRFQRKVRYDNIPTEYISKLKAYIDKQAQNCLIDINHEIAQYDRDKNKAIKGTGRNKLSLSIYYHEENLE
jgi:hypothetical protein